MNRLTLVVEPLRETALPAVNVLIDGTELAELARRAEQAAANDEGHPEIAGGYDGLAPEAWADLPEQYGDGRAAVLGCECGEVGCWPLRVRIMKESDVVVWSDFQQPHRPGWSLAALGPFVFDRAQYDREVSKIVATTRQADV